MSPQDIDANNPHATTSGSETQWCSFIEPHSPARQKTTGDPSPRSLRTVANAQSSVKKVPTEHTREPGRLHVIVWVPLAACLLPVLVEQKTRADKPPVASSWPTCDCPDPRTHAPTHGNHVRAATVNESIHNGAREPRGSATGLSYYANRQPPQQRTTDNGQTQSLTPAAR